jgi:hypothetical protein
MTYDELVTAVSDYCENTFPTVAMNVFIEQAEQRIYSTVQLANLRKNVLGTIAANNKYLSAPDDFLSTYSIAVIKDYGLPTEEYFYLLNKDVNFIREAYPTPADTGQPKHYAIFGPQSANPDELTFILGPTPDVTYRTELHYYYYPESIVTAGQTWLGDNFDSALLNATLVEAIRYMKGEADMVAMYEKMYAQSIALLKNLGDGKQRADAYRDGQVRVQVS